LDYLRTLPDLVRVAIAAGNPDLGMRLADGLTPVYQLDRYALTTARALLAERHGECAEAAGLFTEAADGWQRLEVPWERAQALLGKGRCLLTLGQPAEARQPLEAAREIFASLGTSPALSDADSLLAQAIAVAG
jgi:hypothetical protein